MRTASIMTKGERVLCVETFDTATDTCDVMTPEKAAAWAAEGPVFVWGNGEFLAGTTDLKDRFHKRHNFFISLRAFAPFKSIKPAVQLAEILSGACTDGRVFWRTRAGVEKAWWDNLFMELR